MMLANFFGYVLSLLKITTSKNQFVLAKLFLL